MPKDIVRSPLLIQTSMKFSIANVRSQYHQSILIKVQNNFDLTFERPKQNLLFRSVLGIYNETHKTSLPLLFFFFLFCSIIEIRSMRIEKVFRTRNSYFIRMLLYAYNFLWYNNLRFEIYE